LRGGGRDEGKSQNGDKAHAVLPNLCIPSYVTLRAEPRQRRPVDAAPCYDRPMKLLTVRHATTYRYSAPVSFGQHRLMLRPRDSHDLRRVHAELALAPAGTVRWLHDVFSNSVALVDFEAPAAQLSIVSTLSIERYALARLDFPIAPEAESYPFMHSADDRSDLGRLRERHY